MNKLIAQITFEKFTPESETIVFKPGLNVIYGESSTGKSTILDIIQKEKNVTKQNFEGLPHQYADILIKKRFI